MRFIYWSRTSCGLYVTTFPICEVCASAKAFGISEGEWLKMPRLSASKGEHCRLPTEMIFGDEFFWCVNRPKRNFRNEHFRTRGNFHNFGFLMSSHNFGRFPATRIVNENLSLDGGQPLDLPSAPPIPSGDTAIYRSDWPDICWSGPLETGATVGRGPR